MTLSQTMYDRLQWVIRIFIPAFIAFYVAADQFVNLPKVTEVAGVAGLLAVFLGALLQKSTQDFKKTNEAEAGFLQQTGVDPDTNIPSLGLTITKLPQELLGKKTITLRVDNPFPTPNTQVGPVPPQEPPAPPAEV